MGTGDHGQAAVARGTELAGRERRLLRRLRRSLAPTAEISVALVATPAGDGRAGRRVLALTDDALLIARTPYVRRPAVLRRYERAAVGATNVAPGNSYVDVDGQRWSVGGGWTYQLFRLQQLAAPDRDGASSMRSA
jgi:hypothetical protein